jgi:hypothetical protein
MRKTEDLLKQCTTMGNACDPAELMNDNDARHWTALQACKTKPMECQRVVNGCEGTINECLVRLEWELIEKPASETPENLAKRVVEDTVDMDTLDMAHKEAKVPCPLAPRSEAEFKKADTEWREYLQVIRDKIERKAREKEAAKSPAQKAAEKTQHKECILAHLFLWWNHATYFMDCDTLVGELEWKD